jgi:hypothetical protein
MKVSGGSYAYHRDILPRERVEESRRRGGEGMWSQLPSYLS